MRKYYKLYIDESGTACLTDLVDKRFILAGFIVEDNEDKQLSAYFNFIKKKHNIPEGTQFHSYDLFSNNGHGAYLSDKKATALAESMSEFIETIPITISSIYLDKDELKKYLGIKNSSYFRGSLERKRDKDIGYEALATEIFLWFGKFLGTKSNSVGKIITESRKNSDYAILKTYLKCQNERNFETRRLINNSKSFMKHVASITFEDKKGLSGGLQIVDLISFVSRAAVRRNLSKNENRGLPIIWNALRGKLETKNIKKIGGAPFEHLLSSARVHKITEFNKKT